MISFLVVAATAALAGRGALRATGGVLSIVSELIDSSGVWRTDIKVFSIDISITTSAEYAVVRAAKAALREFVALPDWTEEDQIRLAEGMVLGLARASVLGTDVFSVLSVYLSVDDIAQLRERWRQRRDLAPILTAFGQLVAARATNKTF
jgi:hypothetical protein